MRNMSFALTEDQISKKKKTVTRRLRWKNIEVGELIQAVDRVMGFKRGQHPKKLTVIRIVSHRWEPLNEITIDEVRKEGFPNMTIEEFIEGFCKKFHCNPQTLVHVIEFEYVNGKEEKS